MKRTLSCSPLAAGVATTIFLSIPGHAADLASVTIPAPKLGYSSAFAGQPPHADAPPIDWARSNALVGALRGHAGHLRGTSAEPPVAPVPPAVPAASAAPAHGRHGLPEQVR